MITILQAQPELLIGLGAIALTLIYNAIKDRSDRIKLMRGESIDPRLKIYTRTMVMLWALAGACTASWLLAGLTLTDLGFRSPEGWRAWVSWGLVAPAVAYMVYSVFQVILSRKARDEVREQIRTSGDVDIILPHSVAEHRRFQWASLTAGITEEIIFRGFLIGVLALAFPIWVAAIAATIVFILAHAYQGLKGMLRILPVSVALASIFVIGGSLWPVIVLHAIVDSVSGGIVAITQQFDDEDSEAAVGDESAEPA